MRLDKLLSSLGEGTRSEVRALIRADMTAEQLRDWARMMEIEFVHISKDTTVESLEQELFLNDLAWKLK